MSFTPEVITIQDDADEMSDDNLNKDNPSTDTKGAGEEPAPKSDTQEPKLSPELELARERADFYKQELDRKSQVTAPAASAEQGLSEDELMRITSDPRESMNYFHSTLDTTIDKKQAELKGEVHTLKATLNEVNLRAKYADYDEYKPLIDKEIAHFSPEIKSQPGFAESAYWQIKGKTAAEREAKIREQAVNETYENIRTKKSNQFLVAKAGSREQIPVSLSEDERKAAKGFGMTEQEYIRYKVKGGQI